MFTTMDLKVMGMTNLPRVYNSCQGSWYGQVDHTVDGHCQLSVYCSNKAVA